MTLPFPSKAAAVFAILWQIPGMGFAEDLAQPRDAVVLTVSGQISADNGDGTAKFDMAMLQELVPVEFSTSTIWTDGPQTFKGVLLKSMLDIVGAQGTTVMAYAINDYAIEIPMTDAVEGGPIIAYDLNGKSMSVREKGPLWIVYPYDSNSDYQTEVIYARSIWQVNRIEILN